MENGDISLYGAAIQKINLYTTVNQAYAFTADAVRKRSGIKASIYANLGERGHGRRLESASYFSEGFEQHIRKFPFGILGSPRDESSCFRPHSNVLRLNCYEI